METITIYAISFILGMTLVTALGCNRQAKPPAPSAPAHGEHEHGGAMPGMKSAELMLETTPETLRPGEPVTLSMMLHDASGKMLKEFEKSHEKLAHLILIRDGLDEFAHIHPEVHADGKITVSHSFPKPGKYRLYLDYKAKDAAPATSQQSLNVVGDVTPAPALSVTAPGDIEVDDLIAKVATEPGSKSAVISFDLRDEGGTPVTNLEPYLGAMGHLVVVSADGKQYVHAHPLPQRPGSSEVRFEAHFPGAGLYKAWGQFQRGGVIVTIPAVIDYKASTHAH